MTIEVKARIGTGRERDTHMATKETFTFVVKTTVTFTVRLGDFPPRMLAELIQEKGNGLLTENYGIYDLAPSTPSEVVDEVTYS